MNNEETIPTPEEVILGLALLPHRHDVPKDDPDLTWAEKLEHDQPELRLTRKQAIVVNALRTAVDYAIVLGNEQVTGDDARFEAAKEVMVACGNIVLDFIIDNPNDPTKQ